MGRAPVGGTSMNASAGEACGEFRARPPIRQLVVRPGRVMESDSDVRPQQLFSRRKEKLTSTRLEIITAWYSLCWPYAMGLNFLFYMAVNQFFWPELIWSFLKVFSLVIYLREMVSYFDIMSLKKTACFPPVMRLTTL